MITNLITGIGGFVASHLADLLLSKDEGVHGTARWTEDMSNIQHIRDQLTVCPMDLNDLGSCIKTIEEVRPDYVFHLAAQSFPNESFVYPKVTIETNIIGTMNLLEAIRMVRDRSDDFDPVIHVCSCYDEKTEVLTSRGFLNYKEISIDDHVVSIDPISHDVSYRPIGRVIIQKYKGEMYSVNTRSVDLLITPNHKLLFSSRPSGKLKFSCLSDFERPKKRYYLPKGRFVGKKDDEFLIGIKRYETKSLFYLIGLYIGDGYSRTQTREVVNKSGLTRDEFVGRKNGKGQFVSARTGTKQLSTCHSHRVFLAIPDGDKARFPAIQCLSGMGISFRLYKDEIYFSSKDFVDFLDEFGHTSDTKHIPEWMFEYDAEFLDYLYQGLIDSDGYYYESGERYTTVSRMLSDDLTKLCCFLGKFATMSIAKEGTANLKGRMINSRPSYRFSISSNSRLIENKNIATTFYDGDVWCLEVKDVHNFVVRRNGKTHFCGNSSEVYGLVTEDLVPINENCRFNPANPYGVGKVGTDMLGLMYFTNYGLKTIRTRMFTHSVSRWSPVLIKDEESGMVDIKYISEIRQKRKDGGYTSGYMVGDTQAWNMERYKISVWTDEGWSRLKTISCHPINDHKMLRIRTRASIFEVTDNHSILSDKGDVLDAGAARTGDKILQTSLPVSCGMSVSEDLAWLLGFFVAEGDMGAHKKSSRVFRVANQDKSLLEKCQTIILQHWGKMSTISLEHDGVYRLCMRRPNKLSRFLYSDFYASDKKKRIPTCILNASKETKMAFLRGYNAGDGSKPPRNSRRGKHQEFISFKTNSSILALGLCFLIEETTQQRYVLSMEDRNGKTYYEIALNSKDNQNKGVQNRKPINEIVSIKEILYEGEVWDFETQNNHFQCGIGRGIVHNTGPRRKMLSAEVNFARQIARIEAGKQEPILKHGNLDSIRTWADVRDAVRAYYVLVRECTPGEVYNIGGDTTKTIGEMLNFLLSLSPIGGTIKLEQDPKLLRPYDVTLQIPDCSKFNDATNWKPSISFEKLMRDLLDWCRENF